MSAIAREQAREMMERQLGQLVRLVDDLLDISRISRNKLELRKACIPLASVVENAVETARPLIDSKGHILTVVLSPEPVYLNADLTRLAQVFWNLLNNGASTPIRVGASSVGHDTCTAHDGLEALELAEAFRPDVMLLDIGLPKLNGYDACRRIRQQPWGNGIFIIAVTGWGQEEDRRRSQEAGFNQHLVKPVDIEALEKLLADLEVTAT